MTVNEKQFKQRISKQDGKIGVYFPETHRSKRIMPVDARDHIASGEAVLIEPIVAMNGKAGPVNVKHSQVPKYEKDGYEVVKVLSEEDVEALENDNENPDDVGDTPETYNWDAHTVPQLRGFAEAAHIELPNGANKNTMVELLKKSNFVPDTANSNTDTA